MKNEQADKQVREKLASLETVPEGSRFSKEAVWNRLETRLPAAEKKTVRHSRWFINMGIAAAILLTITIVFFREHLKTGAAQMAVHEEKSTPVKQEKTKAGMVIVKQAAPLQATFAPVKKRPEKNRHRIPHPEPADIKEATEWLRANGNEPPQCMFTEATQPGYTAGSEGGDTEQHTYYIVF